MKMRCSDCQHTFGYDPTQWKCVCGGVLELIDRPVLDPSALSDGTAGVWRYAQALPLDAGGQRVSLGEGDTPLVAGQWNGTDVLFKLEYLNPTGSFKDRGATILVSALKHAGVDRVVDDSSGNAGAALAAYAARGGLAATVYVPARASAAKQAQIAVYGADIERVQGPRSETARAVREGVGDGVAYASHVYSPLYAEGTKTVAFEIWEGLGQTGPDALVLPVGHGSLLLGLFRGFSELLRRGLVERIPPLYGVQAAPCAPLAEAWVEGSESVERMNEGETIAEGVRIANPVRAEAILEAVRASGGAIVSVEDAGTRLAQAALARKGFYVEPTSALAPAALDHLGSELGSQPVVLLTGNGLKSQRN